MFRRALLTASQSEGLKGASVRLPIARGLVDRFVAGEEAADAVATAGGLIESGLTVTVDRLGEDVVEAADALAAKDEVIDLLGQLHAAGLTADAEISLKLSSLGQALPDEGEALALANAREICAKAAEVGTTITLDMEDHTTTDATLTALAALREDYPWVGAVLQAYLFRTEQDCRDLAHEGSRVRLCKGAYAEPDTVAYTRRHDIDLAFVRCMKILMHGDGLPMLATHDPRLIEIGRAVAVHADRPPGAYELQMLLGVRPLEQARLAESGETVRVYVPYGHDWYGYMVRRMAEKPANLSLALKSIRSKK